MTSTRDWMRGGEDQEQTTRSGPTLGGIILWTLGLIVVANCALAAQHLFG